MSDQFTRREVNRALLLGAMALVAPGAAIKAPPVPAPLFDFAIAGGWYHGLRQVRDDLALGEKLVLQAEPANPHDPNAVAVKRGDGQMLGYIPREANEPVARLLERRLRVEAVVVGPLNFRRAADIPDDFAFIGFTDGDPRIRLTLIG